MRRSLCGRVPTVFCQLGPQQRARQCIVVVGSGLVGTDLRHYPAPHVASEGMK